MAVSMRYTSPAVIVGQNGAESLEVELHQKTLRTFNSAIVTYDGLLTSWGYRRTFPSVILAVNGGPLQETPDAIGLDRPNQT